MDNWIHGLCWLIVSAVLLAGCSDSSDGRRETAPTVSVAFNEIPGLVFSQQATLTTNALDRLESISFRVASKPGHASADVQVSFARSYLARRGLLDAATNSVTFPVFALYANHANEVEIAAEFTDSGSLVNDYLVQAPPFEHTGRDVGEIIVHRLTQDPGINFIAVESLGPSVVLFDIDGERRWISPSLGEIVRTHIFQEDHWVIASATDNGLYQVFWDGSVEAHTISDPRYVNSHHNLDPGKVALLNNSGFVDGEIHRPESVVIEMESDGTVLKAWHFDDILAEFIVSRGEDPSALIMNDFDWFHVNSAAYDAGDDALIVSSRENFVIKIDYDTGEIAWLLGNPDKLWYTQYPNSLQTLALAIEGRPPIGQHDLQLSPDGKRIALFNNGFGNLNLPYIGDNQTESTVSIFEIDEAQGTASEVWRYDHSPPIWSALCSGSQWLPDGSFLASYSQIRRDVVDGRELDQHSRLVHVSPDGEVLFEASVLKREIDDFACNTVYKSRAIPLESLNLD